MNDAQYTGFWCCADFYNTPSRRGLRDGFEPVSLKFSLDKFVGRSSSERIPIDLSGRFHSPMFSAFAMFGGRC